MFKFKYNLMLECQNKIKNNYLRKIKNNNKSIYFKLFFNVIDKKVKKNNNKIKIFLILQYI